MEKEKRTTFHGDDEDYQYPWHHRYNEPDSDRGASDEHHESTFEEDFENSYIEEGLE